MPETTDHQPLSLPEKIAEFYGKYSRVPESSPVIVIQNYNAVFRRELATILRGMMGRQKIEVIETANINDVIARVRERVVVALLGNSCVDTSTTPLSPHTARIITGDLPDGHKTKGSIDYISSSLEPAREEESILEDWLRPRIKRSLELAISCGLAHRSELLEENRQRMEEEAKKKKKGRGRARK